MPSNKETESLEIQEFDQSKRLTATYIKSPSNASGERVDVVIPKNTISFARSVLNAFLPAGYPNSVTDDYLEYQIYDSLQAFSSSIAGMLSSRAVLEGIGVGDSHASPTSALLLSVLQESMGRLATILFAHRLGSSLEPECKMYRLSADIFNDAAMILDCLSPALPKVSRVGLLSASSVLRALCGVAAGSSKASLSAHFATVGNLGELNAKDSSQETVISLMGMLVGSVVVSHISSKWATWTVLLFLLAVHLGTNYLAVRAVCMRTLNRQRANLVFSAVLEQIEGEKAKFSHQDGNNRGLRGSALPGFVPPPPGEVYLQERIFERDGVLRWKGGEILGNCRLGVEFRDIVECFGQQNSTTGSYTGSKKRELAQLLGIFEKDDYIVWYDEPCKMFLIVLKDGSDTESQLAAWMLALQYAKFSRKHGDQTVLEALTETAEYVRKIRGDVLQSLEKVGWDLETAALETRSGTRIAERRVKHG